MAGAPLAAQLCNTTPVAVDDRVSFAGGVVAVDVLSNDSDADGEALEVLGLSTTCDGTVSEDFGLVTLEVARFEQECTITYQVQDERGGRDTGTVTVEDATGIFTDGFESGDISRWNEDTEP